jgi:hypothetical protein
MSLPGRRNLGAPRRKRAMEYQLLMEVRDEAGKLLSRQTVGLGALRQGEQRIFSLRLEVFAASA